MVFYEFTPDRKGKHPQRRLRDFQGILQADAYSGFNARYESGRVVEAACWTHARRYFHDEMLAKLVTAFATALADWIDLIGHGRAKLASDPAHQ